MTKPITVKVTVNTDELREWADKHADAGHHGVAHVLYKAANDGESLTEQAIREAKAEERERIAQAIEAEHRRVAFLNEWASGYRSGLVRASGIARHTPEATSLTAADDARHLAEQLAATREADR